MKPECLQNRRVGACLSAIESYGFELKESFTAILQKDTVYKFHEMLSERPLVSDAETYLDGSCMICLIEFQGNIDGLIDVYKIEKNFPVKLSTVHGDEIVEFWFG